MYSVCVRTDNSKFGLRYTKNLRTMGMRRSRGGGGGIWTSLENSDLKSTPLSYRKKGLGAPENKNISWTPLLAPWKKFRIRSGRVLAANNFYQRSDELRN